MSFYLGPSGYENAIPTPSEFSIETRLIAREGRTASGRLVRDVVARKRVFRLTWRALEQGDVQTLLAEYERNQVLSFKYPDREGTRQANVLFAEFPRALLWLSPEWWTDITATLEEV